MKDFKEMQNITELKETSAAASNSTITANFTTMSDSTTAEIYLYVAGRTSAGVTGIAPFLASPAVALSEWYHFGDVAPDTAKGAGHYKFTFAYKLPVSKATVFEIGVKIDDKALEAKAKITLTPQDFKDATMQVNKTTIDANDKDVIIVTLKVPHVKDDLGYRLKVCDELHRSIKFKRKGTDNTTYEAAYTVPLDGAHTLVSYDDFKPIVTTPKEIKIMASSAGHKVEPKHGKSSLDTLRKMSDAGSADVTIYLTDSTGNPLDGKAPVLFLLKPSGVTAPADYSFTEIKPDLSEGHGYYSSIFKHNSALDKPTEFQIAVKVDDLTLDEKPIIKVMPQDLKEATLSVIRTSSSVPGVFIFLVTITVPHVKDDISSRLKLQDSKGKMLQFKSESAEKNHYILEFSTQDDEIHSFTVHYNSKVIDGLPVLALTKQENLTNAELIASSNRSHKGERISITLKLPYVASDIEEHLKLVDDHAEAGALSAFRSGSAGTEYYATLVSNKVATHKVNVTYKGKLIHVVEPLEIEIR